ncbi:MAG: hypothetical protein U0931_16175 [Vulcanimicrobiota bacterium]
MKPGNNLRGSSLGVVLVTITLGSLLVFGSLSAGLQQLELSNHLQLRARARDSAESVLHLAIAKLAKEPAFGAAHESTAVLSCGAPGLGDGCSAVLSFDSATASSNHIPMSTNNLASDTSAVADGGRAIPGNSCHLVALGQCFSEKIQIETVYIQPPFPTGCASSGQVKLQDVRLWGIPPSTVMQTSASSAQTFLQSVPPVPAHVYTNSRKPDGLILGRGTSIRGNAACSGGIVQDPSAIVDGEIQPHSRDNVVPHYDVPAMYGNIAQYVGQVPYQEGQPVQSFCVVGSDLTIAGDADIQGGVLAVRGNLTIQGALKGQGFIIATGNISAHGNTNFSGADKMAVLAGGNLDLSGQNQVSYVFNGILYAQGNVTAHDLTVIGALIGDSPNGTGVVDLQRMTVAQTDVSVVGQVTADPEAAASSGPQAQNAAALQLSSDPLNPRRQVLTGSISHNNQQLSNTRAMPSPAVSGWVVSFNPPEATITIWPGGATHTVPFAGQASPFPYNSAPVDPYASNANNRYKAFENGPMWNLVSQETSASPQALREAFGKACHVAWFLSLPYDPATSKYYQLEINNLLPRIDRTRVVTWSESSPSR